MLWWMYLSQLRLRFTESPVIIPFPIRFLSLSTASIWIRLLTVRSRKVGAEVQRVLMDETILQHIVVS
jgi:hypothetical protein